MVSRTELAAIGTDDRHRFTAVFGRYGRKGRTKTLLLLNIRDADGNMVADHQWFRTGKWSDELGELQTGMELSFNARVKEYEKGYRGTNERKAAKRPPHTVDVKLANPTNVRLTGNVVDVDVGESRSEQRKKSRRR